MNDKTRELMRKARETKGMKQTEVAELMGVTGAAISSWEKGKTDIDIDSFITYCQICEVSYLEILNQAYGDPTKMQNFRCTEQEIDLLKKYRSLDARGQRVVQRVLNAEYEDALASFGEELRDVTGRG